MASHSLEENAMMWLLASNCYAWFGSGSPLPSQLRETWLRRRPSQCADFLHKSIYILSLRCICVTITTGRELTFSVRALA